jgi:DNA-binding IclR family transcriptional regulator
VAVPSTPLRPTLATLDKLADLLRAFRPEHPRWKLHELATYLEWDKATAYRFLAKLTDLRFLERDDEGNFSLGTFVLEVSSTYLGASPARQRLIQVMDQVRNVTGLTTQAGFLDGSEVVIALSEEGTSLVKASASLGARLPIHATAIGKVILAQLDDEALGSVLSRDLPSFTDRTIVSPARLLIEVQAAQAAGVASASAELAAGLDAVAVALPPSVFGAPAGLGCSGPSAEVGLRRDVVESSLREAAADLRLGYDLLFRASPPRDTHTSFD